MKILISTLLLTIALFLYFREINTSGNRRASSSFKTAQGGGLFVVQKYLSDGEAHKTVKFGDLDIEVWLDSSRTRVLKAWYPNCGIPYGNFYEKKEFLIRLIELEGLKLVAYKGHDNSLIGVRAPKRGQKFDLEPTESKWYIIYFSKTFELKIKPGTNMVTGIRLMGRNSCEPKYSAQHVQIAGIKFTVFKGRFSKITGAEIGFL